MDNNEFELKEQLKSIKYAIAENKGKEKEFIRSIQQRKEETKKLKESLETGLEEKLILQEACDTARQIAYDMFSTVATNGLQCILGDNISVEIHPGERNNIATADFKVKTQYDDFSIVTDPIESEGGGVSDIISLASFVCMNALNEDNNASPLFLDEPTKFVSEKHTINVSKFLKEISKEYKKQIIMVTHAKETMYLADKAFYTELNNNGISKTTEAKEKNM